MPSYLTVTEAAEDTLRKIMAQRTNRSGIHVIVTTQGGGTASVKYDAPSRRATLNLPSLPASAQVSRAHADRITGYVIHEACHVLHTDWAAWTRAVKAGARIRYWTNGLEDMRIEAHEIAHGSYPAMRDLLGRVSDRMFRDALAGRAKAGQFAPGTMGTVDAPYVLSVIARLRNGYAIPSARDLERNLSPQTRKLVAYALRWLPKCRDTDACLRLARRLVALEAQMKQADQPAPPPIDEPQPQADDDQADDAQADDAQTQADDAQADDAQTQADDARPMTPRPMTTRPMTTRPMTTRPMMTRPRPMTPRPMTPRPRPMTPRPMTPRPMTPRPRPMTTRLMTTRPMTPRPMTPRPMTTRPMTTRPMTTRPMMTRPRPMTPRPMTPRPMTPRPMTPRPMTPRPMTTNRAVPLARAPETPRPRPLPLPKSPRTN
jgi:hypothetical protein